MSGWGWNILEGSLEGDGTGGIRLQKKSGGKKKKWEKPRWIPWGGWERQWGVSVFPLNNRKTPLMRPQKPPKGWEVQLREEQERGFRAGKAERARWGSGVGRSGRERVNELGSSAPAAPQLSDGQRSKNSPWIHPSAPFWWSSSHRGTSQRHGSPRVPSVTPKPSRQPPPRARGGKG